MSIFHIIILLLVSGLWPPLRVNRETQTVSHFFPKLSAALQRKMQSAYHRRALRTSSSRRGCAFGARENAGRATHLLIRFPNWFHRCLPCPEFFPAATDR